MKATELRLGNLIQYSNDEFWSKDYRNTHHHLNIDDLIHIVTHDTQKLFEPISLTKEWLPKLGLQKFGDDEWLLPNSTYRIMGEKDEWFRLRVHNNIFDVRIKYVHQLQNLYFTLTEMELAVTAKNNGA